MGGGGRGSEWSKIRQITPIFFLSKNILFWLLSSRGTNKHIGVKMGENCAYIKGWFKSIYPLLLTWLLPKLMLLTPMVDFFFLPFPPALLAKVCLWSSHGLTEYMKENERRMRGLVEGQATIRSSPFLVLWFPDWGFLPWLRFSTLTEVFYPDWCFLPWLRFRTLTEVFPCFFLSCKANARVKLTSRGTVRTLQK